MNKEKDIKELDRKIKDAKNQHQPEDDEALARQAEDANTGKKAGIEFSAHIIAGGLIGYFVDYLFDTLPLFFIIMMGVGFASGIYRSYLIMND